MLLDLLLILDFFLHILVSLQDLVVFELTEFVTFFHTTVQFLAQRIHFLLLLANQISLSSLNLLFDILSILSTFIVLNSIGMLLDLVSFSIILLFGHVFLLLPQIQKLGAAFEHGHQLGLHLLSLFNDGILMTLSRSIYLVLVSLQGRLELLVPMLIELLVLTNVCLFTFLFLGLVHEQEFLLLPSEFIVFELIDSIVGHLCFYVAALSLHLQPVLIQGLSTKT